MLQQKQQSWSTHSIPRKANLLSGFLPHPHKIFTVELHTIYMLLVLVVILAILWFFGYVHIGWINVPDISLFVINGQTVTLWNLLILAVVVTILSILPGPIRIIAGVLLVFWILSVLGIISLAGLALSNLLIIAIIIAVVFSLFSAAI
jgi:hypothetical protein